MAIDPTMSESCYKKSLKKFFIDNLYTSEGIDVDFDIQYVMPKDAGLPVKKWVSIKVGAIEGGTLSRGHVILYLFTREDNEGVDLSELRDIILEKITDTNATDGVVRIPFYDQSWNQVGAMVPALTVESREPEYLEDGTKVKWMRIDLSWGSR